MKLSTLYKYGVSIIFILLSFVYLFWFEPLPYQNYDPEYLQLHNALKFLETGKIAESYNPSIMIGIVLGLFLKVNAILSSLKVETLVWEHSETILIQARYFFLLLCSITILRFNYRLSCNYNTVKCNIILSPLLFGYTLLVAPNIISSRPILFILCIFLIELVILGGKRSKEIILSLLLLFTKMTAAPYIFFLLIKDGVIGLKKILIIGVLFVSGVYFLVNNYMGTFNFISGGLLTHGEYGTGSSFIDTDKFLSNFVYLFKRNFVLFGIWGGLIVSYLYTFKGMSKSDSRLFMILLLADFALLFLVLRHRPSSYYLTPMYLFMIIKVWLFHVQIVVLLQKYKRGLLGLVSVIIFLMVFLGLDKYDTALRRKDSVIRNSELIAIYNDQFPGQKILDSKPTVHFANFVGSKSIEWLLRE